MANSGLDIEATDVSAELIFKLDYNLGRIAHTRVQAAEYGAVVPNFYDWSFSFEPYPVFDRCFGVEEVSRLGLLNNLGLKVAYKSEGCVLDENHGLRLACLAEVYEASMDTKVVEIDGFAGGKAGTYKSSIISLATNPKARKKAELDIYVERAMHSITAKGGCLVKILSEKLEVEGPLIRESVERLRLCEESGVVTLG